MSTPEQQVDFLLTPLHCEGGVGQVGTEQSSLDDLQQFHDMLCEHSGVNVLEEGEEEGEEEEGLQGRLQELYDIVLKRQRTQESDTEVVRCEEVKGKYCMCRYVVCEECVVFLCVVHVCFA